jgi:outer membrane protein assembly factor BamB
VSTFIGDTSLVVAVTDDPSRRRLLAAVATSASLAGCGSLLDRDAGPAETVAYDGTPSSPDSGWTMARSGPGNTRWTRRSGGLGEPAWSTAAVAGPIHGDLPTDGQRVYVGDGTVGLTVLDVASGAVEWQLVTGPAENSPATDSFPEGVGPVGPPALGQGLAFVGDEGGTLRAVRASDGRIVWQPRPGDGPLPGRTSEPTGGRDGRDGPGPPTYHDGLVVLGTAGAVHALDATDGSTRWSTDVERLAAGPPAVTDRRVVVSTADGLVALDRDGGGRAWSKRLGRGRQPAVVGDTVVVAAEEFDADDHRRRVVALDAASGTVRWRQPGGYWYVQPAVTDRAVYVADERGVRKLSLADGTVRWTGPELWGPAVGGEQVFGIDPVTPPRLVALDPATGERTAEWTGEGTDWGRGRREDWALTGVSTSRSSTFVVAAHHGLAPGSRVVRLPPDGERPG